MGRHLFNAADWRSISSSLGLSPREFEIVQQLFDNEKEARIATTLRISTHTVHSYVHRMYRKLGIASRSELLLLVFSEYLDLPEKNVATPRTLTPRLRKLKPSPRS